jgi:cation diffusion facilitator CzcD-associated flavoprotein CzcO
VSPPPPEPAAGDATAVPAIVVGAGPAGLAASRELALRGVEHLVLEAASIGSSWAGYYRNLVLHTGKHLSHLPGRRLPRDTPLFPPRERFLGYLRDYAEHFDLPVREGVRVLSARPDGGRWRIETSAGPFRAGALIVATGIAARPHRPALAGEEVFGGEILHSSAYSEPQPYRGRRVLVVGVGNSGGEIAGELAAAGVDTAVSVRSGAHLMPLRILGLPSQYWGALFGVFPRPVSEGIARGLAALRRLASGPPPLPIPDRPLLARPPLIGDSLPAAIRSGRVRLRGAVARLLPGAVRFTDGTEEGFDVVILATGYRPAVDFLDGVVTVDAEGFPLRAGVRSAERDGLFFVGHRYDPSGALAAIRGDAPRAAREVARVLHPDDAPAARPARP